MKLPRKRAVHNKKWSNSVKQQQMTQLLTLKETVSPRWEELQAREITCWDWTLIEAVATRTSMRKPKSLLKGRPLTFTMSQTKTHSSTASQAMTLTLRDLETNQIISTSTTKWTTTSQQKIPTIKFQQGKSEQIHTMPTTTERAVSSRFSVVERLMWWSREKSWRRSQHTECSSHE